MTSDAAAHLGTVLIAGVVGRVDADKSLLLLVDRAEVEQCGLECEDEPGKQVPVRWSGDFPKVGSEVLVSGHLARQVDALILTGEYAGKPAPLDPRGGER